MYSIIKYKSRSGITCFLGSWRSCDCVNCAKCLYAEYCKTQRITSGRIVHQVTASPHFIIFYIFLRRMGRRANLVVHEQFRLYPNHPKYKVRVLKSTCCSQSLTNIFPTEQSSYLSVLQRNSCIWWYSIRITFIVVSEVSDLFTAVKETKIS